VRKLLGIIAAASVAEIAFAGAIVGVAGLGGWWSAWLDLFAAVAPIALVLGAVGAALAFAAFPAGRERRIVLGLGLAGVLAAAILITPELLSPGPTPAAKTGPPLKLLTFNVWDHNRDTPGTVTAILASGADVVALQEETLTLEDTKRLLPTYPYWAPCRLGCSVTLISKQPWTATGQPAGAAPLPSFAWWGVTRAPDGQPVQIVSAHYVWPAPPSSGQAGQRAALARFLASLSEQNVLVTGDFNLAPWMATLRRQDASFAPLTRRTHGVFTWPAMMADIGWPAPFPILPIDQVYAGPAWKTLAVSRLPLAGSDHYGVLVTLGR
jgi:endonuclease/exonuclease/phosphatase (EEP) superfamily protein YafD